MTEKQELSRLYSCRSEHRQENLPKLKAGDSFRDFVGPLGCPSELCERGKPGRDEKEEDSVCSRRVNFSSVYPQMKWLHEHGIDADVIVGAKTKDLVILEDKFKSVAVIFT